MRKYISVILLAAMALFCLSACGDHAVNNSTEPFSNNQEKRLQIVTTIFPEYDWVREIIGDNADHVDLTMLLDSGVDLHNYQPTVEDILKISTCDLFIYVGGESDEWVEDALQEAANKDMRVINLLEMLGDAVKEEEIIEGMEAEEDEDDEDEGLEYDEHVWLSLKNAKILCEVIADTLAEMDPDNAEIYLDNAAVYGEKLLDLDMKYQSAINAAAQKTILFGDRFPFRYLAADYGLSYYAAFSGCSAETEASFDTIIFLAGKVDELGLNSVLTVEKSDQKIANTIVQNTQGKNQKLLELDSMQSTISSDVSGGTTYLSIMESNLNVLKEALQ